MQKIEKLVYDAWSILIRVYSGKKKKISNEKSNNFFLKKRYEYIYIYIYIFKGVQHLIIFILERKEKKKRKWYNIKLC